MRVAVISSISEPVPGWMDNFHGPVGLLAAAGKGLVHIALADQSVVADYMPVDIAIKAVIVAAWERATATSRGPGPGPAPAVPIYNCSSAAVKPVPMSKMVAMARPLAAEIPFDDVLWPTYALTTSSRFVLLLGTLLLHMVPALVIDAVLRLQGRKPRSVHEVPPRCHSPLRLRSFPGARAPLKIRHRRRLLTSCYGRSKISTSKCLQSASAGQCLAVPARTGGGALTWCYDWRPGRGPGEVRSPWTP